MNDCCGRALTRVPRRTLLAAGVLAAAGAGVLGRATLAEDGHEGPPWAYEGDEGPEHWGDHYPACSGGGQSPIDIAPAAAEGRPLENVHVEYPPFELFRIINNGHTIRVPIEHESLAYINGVAYQLKEFHFHAPSEHAFNNHREALEMHLVHRAVHDEHEVAVLGVLLRVGAHNEALRPIFTNLPTGRGNSYEVHDYVEPARFLPDNPITFRYTGSLTTPACDTGVNWIVFEEPVEISAHQAAAFTARYVGNSRPLQESNNRDVTQDTTP